MEFYIRLDKYYRNITKQLYFAFFQSYLNYANIAWASTHTTKLQCLHRHQKHAVRLINYKDRYTHASPLLKDIKVLNVYELNIFNILCLMYKCKNEMCPPALRDLYNPRPRNKYILREKDALFEPFCRNSFSQFCITYRGPYLWNKIVLSKNVLSHSSNYSLFKNKLREVILSLQDLKIL